MTGQVNQYDPQGRRHGIWEHYRPDGTLWWRGRFLHGKLHGLLEEYYKDGTVEGKKYILTIK